MDSNDVIITKATHTTVVGDEFLSNDNNNNNKPNINNNMDGYNEIKSLKQSLSTNARLADSPPSNQTTDLLGILFISFCFVFFYFYQNFLFKTIKIF
jgi:hypothetical protein